jgi:hypothetical protein
MVAKKFSSTKINYRVGMTTRCKGVLYVVTEVLPTTIDPGNDDETVYHAWVRQATEEEVAAVLAKEAAAKDEAEEQRRHDLQASQDA